MVEGARLESVYALIAYRGFESLSLRQIAIATEYAGCLTVAQPITSAAYPVFGITKLQTQRCNVAQKTSAARPRYVSIQALQPHLINQYRYHQLCSVT